MSFWSSAAPQVPGAPAGAPTGGGAPKAHVFSTSHAHVHHPQHFMKVVCATMNLAQKEFKVAMHSIEDSNANSVYVSVAAVIHMAKLMSTFASFQTTEAEVNTCSIVLAYEVGKVESTLGRGDKVIIFTSENSLHTAFANRSDIVCVDLGRIEEIFTQEPGRCVALSCL